jgi:serine/threonine-protein kinase
MEPLDDDDGRAPTSLKQRVMDPDDEALLGKKLGEYRVDSVLGEGGMGIVFKGEQLLIKKTVAIKVLKRALAAESSFASRLLDEARAVNAIHHPAIIDAFGFGQTPDGRPYIVMEFVQGEPLDARLAAKGTQSVEETLKLLLAVLAPLEAAHSARVIHRDLKPSNVFLQRLPDGTDFPKLLDFGLARYVDAKGRGTGIVGTPAYMAPEQAKDGDITPAVDLYALGCLAYELLSGRPPFEGATLWAILEQHLTATPRPLTSLLMNVDDEVSDFVAELLSKAPEQRPTATQARREVARMLRAREQAATQSEERPRKLDGPTPRGATRVEHTEPHLPVDTQEAQTVLGLGGVDAPLPAPRGPRPGKRSPEARKTTVNEPAIEDELPAIRGRPVWFWPVLGLVVLGVVVAIALAIF